MPLQESFRLDNGDDLAQQLAQGLAFFGQRSVSCQRQWGECRSSSERSPGFSRTQAILRCKEASI